MADNPTTAIIHAKDMKIRSRTPAGRYPQHANWATSISNSSYVFMTSTGGKPYESKYSIAIKRVAETSLAQGGNPLTAFLSASSFLRRSIRKEHITPRLMTLAITSFQNDEMQIAWSGDVYAVRLRNGSAETIAYPSRAGRLDLLRDPLGSSPALTRRHVHDGDLLLMFSAGIKPLIHEKVDLLKKLYSTQSLEGSAIAASHVTQRFELDPKTCQIAQVRKVY